MYIEKTYQHSNVYYNSSGRHLKRADNLILIQKQDINSKEIKAIVRKVSLSQSGHFMMGIARIGNKSFTVSGPYGNDGLPLIVDDETFEKYGVLLPKYLYELWNKGGGHNSCGNEAEEMRKWANNNLKALKSKTRKIKF